MSDPTPEQRLWAHAIDTSTFGVWDLDLRLDLVHYSPQWKSRLGFPRVDAPDSSAFWRCRVHPDDLDTMLRSLFLHLDGCSPTYEMQFRLRSNGSGYRTMLSRGRVIARDGSGNATRMVGTMVDLKGRPASGGNHGLPDEDPSPNQVLPRPPFHAVLAFARDLHAASTAATGAPGAVQSDGSHDQARLADLVGDLLDIALRDADAAR